MAPNSERTPAVNVAVRNRNWLIVQLLLLMGLRRSKCLVLPVDALKEQVDARTGEVRWWLDSVTLSDVASNTLGDGPASVVGKLVIGRLAEESHISKTFKKVQAEHGDAVAFEYLKANTDGFHCYSIRILHKLLLFEPFLSRS